MRMTSSSPAHKEQLENEVRPLVEQFLRDRGLSSRPRRPASRHIEQGFDFLGQNIRKHGGKLLIKPSKKNTHAFLEKVRQHIRQGGGHQPGRLDSSTQSRHSGLGQLPSPCGGQGDVQKSGMGSVAQPLAMGQTPAPRQGQPMDHPAILALHWRNESVRARHRRTDAQRQADLVAAGQPSRNQRPAASSKSGAKRTRSTRTGVLFSRPCVLQKVRHPPSRGGIEIRRVNRLRDSGAS